MVNHGQCFEQLSRSFLPDFLRLFLPALAGVRLDAAPDRVVLSANVDDFVAAI
jgi:hypothetical protein